MTILALSNFKSHCSKAINSMQNSNKPIVLTKHGEPVAKVIPLHGKKKQKKLKKDEFFGMFKGRFEIVGDIMSPLDVEWDVQK
jgi:prevent-host-death family protein